MRKVIIFCMLLIITTEAVAQTLATTKDGKEVVLADDGTWKFKKSKAKQKNTNNPGDCSDWIKSSTDKVSGKSNTAGKNRLTVSNDGKSGLTFILMSPNNGDIILSITAVGSSPCIDKGSNINILFRDGSRLQLSSDIDFNCDSNSTVYFGGPFGKTKQLEDLAGKEIETMRVWTRDGFVEENFTDKQSNEFKNTMQCLAQK